MNKTCEPFPVGNRGVPYLLAVEVSNIHLLRGKVTSYTVHGFVVTAGN